MDDISIRPIEIADLDQFTWTGGKTHLEYFAKALERTLDGKVLFLGAWLEGKAVGRCGIDFEKHPGKAFLWMFNVKDELQGRGIGSKLMVEAESQIKANGMDEVVLNVEKDNKRAQELYLRRGYSIIGEGTESWEEDGPDNTRVTYNADVVNMSKTLS